MKKCIQFLFAFALSIFACNTYAYQCVGGGTLAPDVPPGGSPSCSTNPGAHQVNIYTGINYTGYCVVLTAVPPNPVVVNNFSTYGWGPDALFPIKSIKVGFGQSYFYESINQTGVGHAWAGPYLGVYTISDTTAYPLRSGQMW